MPTFQSNTVIRSDFDEARRLQAEIEEALRTCDVSERNCVAVKIAFEEAITNAIKHGNQMDPDKNIAVQYQISSELFQARITDQGDGFDTDDTPDLANPEYMLRPRGRGLLMIRYFMTEVTFYDGGRTIVLKKSFGPDE